MFGLGPGELMLLGLVVTIVGGPSAIRTVMGWMKSANKAKRILTPQGLVGMLMSPSEKSEKTEKNESVEKPEGSSKAPP